MRGYTVKQGRLDFLSRDKFGIAKFPASIFMTAELTCFGPNEIIIRCRLTLTFLMIPLVLASFLIQVPCFLIILIILSVMGQAFLKIPISDLANVYFKIGEELGQATEPNSLY